MLHNNRVPIKVSFVGLTNVGKTSLIHAMTGKTVEPYYIPTIGIDLALKSTSEYKLQLWDLSGQIRFRDFTRNYVDSSNILVLCFSAEDKSSFHEIIDLYNFYKERHRFLLAITKTKSSDAKDSYTKWIEESPLGDIKCIETDSVAKVGIHNLTNSIIKLYEDNNQINKKIKENYKRPVGDNSCIQFFGYSICNIL